MIGPALMTANRKDTVYRPMETAQVNNPLPPMVAIHVVEGTVGVS